jgi:hypothetical protein
VVEAHELKWVESDGLAQPNGEMAAVVPGGGGRSGFVGEPRPVGEARSRVAEPPRFVPSARFFPFKPPFLLSSQPSLSSSFRQFGFAPVLLVS